MHMESDQGVERSLSGIQIFGYQIQNVFFTTVLLLVILITAPSFDILWRNW